MSVRNNLQSINTFRLTGSLSLLSEDVFPGDVMTHSFGLAGKIVRVTIKPECLCQRRGSNSWHNSHGSHGEATA